MTPEERARTIVMIAMSRGISSGEQEAMIASAIREAVAAEREACALTALRVGPAAKDPDGPWHDIAAAIRAREDA